MEKKYLLKREIEGKTFYYLLLGEEEHKRPSLCLWINRRLVQRDETESYIQFPVRNARVVRTEKGNYVLRPEQGWNTYDVGVSSGYRGISTLEVLEPSSEVFTYREYASPLGSLGVSQYALVSASSDEVKVRWKRSGRLYGRSPKGVSIYYSDGRIEELPDGIDEIQKELEE